MQGSSGYVPKQLPPRVRLEVKARDGHRCVCCGSTATPLDVDHIVPASLGGSDDLGNLQTLCRGCNTKKGKKERCPCQDADYVPSTSTLYLMLKQQRLMRSVPKAFSVERIPLDE